MLAESPDEWPLLVFRYATPDPVLATALHQRVLDALVDAGQAMAIQGPYADGSGVDFAVVSAQAKSAELDYLARPVFDEVASSGSTLTSSMWSMDSGPLPGGGEMELIGPSR